jgi:hypothetical protein
VRILTISTYDRPRYLAETLTHLAKNRLDGWEVFFGVEPGGRADEVVKICEAAPFPRHIHLNKTQLGAGANKHATISRAFDAGAEAVMSIPDDVALSPDATTMADWFFGLPPKYECLSLCQYQHWGMNDPTRPAAVLESGVVGGTWSPVLEAASHPFSGFGLCITRQRWRSFFQKNWIDDSGKLSFDANLVQEMAKHPDRRVLVPAFSRAKHIGYESSIHPEWNIVYEGTRNDPFYEGPVGLKYRISQYVAKK